MVGRAHFDPQIVKVCTQLELGFPVALCNLSSMLTISPTDRVFILAGAGVSAESGIPTFRGMGGLWRSYRIEEVASPYWGSDPFGVEVKSVAAVTTLLKSTARGNRVRAEARACCPFVTNRRSVRCIFFQSYSYAVPQTRQI